MAYRPGGKVLASGDDAGTLILWELATGRQLLKRKAHNGALSGLAFNSDGGRLATTSYNPIDVGDEVKLWDPDRGQEIMTLPGRLTVAFSADGHRLAATGLGGLDEMRQICVWDGTPRKGNRD